jgi:hypothetical protein
MIVLDNAVECCFRSYISSEKRLVGNNKPIKPNQWANDAKFFTKVMDHAYTNCPSQSLPDKNEIMHFHDTRNELYHRAKPLTVPSGVVRKYLGFAKVLLKEFYGFSMTDEAWDEYVASIRNAFKEKPAQIRLPIVYQKEGANVRVDGVEVLDQKEVIPIVMLCFSTSFGRNPTTNELINSMTVSGISIGRDTLAVQLFYLRKNTVVKKKKYEVTNRHRKVLNTKYELRRGD